MLKQMDLIIGPAYQSQVSYVAKFAQENKIKTIIPFSSNITDINTNKYLYQGERGIDYTLYAFLSFKGQSSTIESLVDLECEVHNLKTKKVVK